MGTLRVNKTKFSMAKKNLSDCSEIYRDELKDVCHQVLNYICCYLVVDYDTQANDYYVLGACATTLTPGWILGMMSLTNIHLNLQKYF